MEATNSKIINTGVNLNYFFIFCTETSYRFFPPSKERIIISKVNHDLVRALVSPSTFCLWIEPTHLIDPTLLSNPQSDFSGTSGPPWDPHSFSGSLCLQHSGALQLLWTSPTLLWNFRSFRGEATLNTLAFLGPNEESLHLSHCLWIMTRKSRPSLQWQSWGAKKDSWACPMHPSWWIQKCQWRERSLSMGFLGDRGHEYLVSKT